MASEEIVTYRRSRLVRPRWADRVRRGLALLVVLLGVLAVASGWAEVCSDELTPAGTLVTSCRAPQATDGIVIGYGLLVLLLLAPDLAEAGVPGLLTLRRRMEEQESRLETEEARRELLESQLVSLSAQISQSATARAIGVDALNIYVSGEETADFAAADRPPGPSEAASAGPAVVVDRVSRARYTAADLFIRRLRSYPEGPLLGSSLHLYLPDETGLMLVPAFEVDRAGGAADWWQVGQGVVGRAWRDREVLTARGEEVFDGVDNLPLSRRERYAALAVVAAVPVLNAVGRPVAVLAASASDPASALDSAEGIEDLVTHADAIARVIVDLLGWESDGEQGGR